MLCRFTEVVVKDFFYAIDEVFKKMLVVCVMDINITLLNYCILFENKYSRYVQRTTT